jgi:hypothetical protein
MKKAIGLVSVAMLAMGFAGGMATRAEAAQAPSQALYYTALNGNYAFSTPGLNNGSDPASGTFTFDGKGHVTGVMNMTADTVACAGMTLVGTYTVNPGLASGFAQMSLTSVATGGCALVGSSDTLPIVLYIASGGKVLYFAEMDDEGSGYFSNDFSILVGTAVHY